jgi:hypothetical protein
MGAHWHRLLTLGLASLHPRPSSPCSLVLETSTAARGAEPGKCCNIYTRRQCVPTIVLALLHPSHCPTPHPTPVVPLHYPQHSSCSYLPRTGPVRHHQSQSDGGLPCVPKPRTRLRPLARRTCTPLVSTLAGCRPVRYIITTTATRIAIAISPPPQQPWSTSL